MVNLDKNEAENMKHWVMQVWIMHCWLLVMFYEPHFLRRAHIFLGISNTITPHTGTHTDTRTRTQSGGKMTSDICSEAVLAQRLCASSSRCSISIVPGHVCSLHCASSLCWFVFVLLETSGLLVAWITPLSLAVLYRAQISSPAGVWPI